MPESVFGGTGRPDDAESRRRKGVFLCLIADGLDPVTARKQARIHPDRALRIVTETDFREIVEAIRAGAGPVAAVIEPADKRQAA